MKKTIVIGDIHGCYDEFLELINQIEVDDDDLLISLGDIVDRGNKSVECYNYFKNRKNSIVLMGNHERKHLNGILSYSQEIVKVQFQNEYDGFLLWLESLPYFYETDEALIIHAFFEHDKIITAQREDVLAGTTSGSRYLENKYEIGKYWSDYYQGDKPIIYGHHVVGDTPKIENKTYGIDTGACHGGFLTAIELPNFKIHQVQVKRDYWKDEQSKWQIPVLEAKDWDNMAISKIYHQIEKLNYKEEQDLKVFLENLKLWVDEVNNLRIKIKNKIQDMTLKLLDIYPESFHQEISKFICKPLIYKAKSNNLTFQEIDKILDTPKKILEIATELDILPLPVRKSVRG